MCGADCLGEGVAVGEPIGGGTAVGGGGGTALSCVRVEIFYMKKL